jgi:hypothetical protein
MRRTLSLLALVICVPALLYADEAEDKAVEALKRVGARVRVDKKSGTATKVDFARKPVSDDQLKHLADLPKLREINLGGVYLRGSDNVFAPRQITDKGLKHVAGLTELRSLMLDGTHVTDAGMKHLAGLKNLQTLVLSGTKVTDAGMKELAGLKKLSSVMVDKTKVTTRGAAVLKKAIPEVDVFLR